MSKKRNIMRAFKMNEISAVDRPAQEHARMLLMKRADTNDKPLKKETTMTFSAEQLAEIKKLTDTAAEEAVTKAKEASDAELALAKTYGEFNDVTKAHYNSLDEAGKKDFMTKSAEQRKSIVEAELAKAADKDPVVFKSEAGVEYRKSAGEPMIALAKQNDENAKELKKQREANENAALQKRAGDMFPHTPGTVEAKAAMLKGIESISDEKLRKEALEAAVAGDKALSAAFKSVGNSKTNPAADGTPQANFDAGLKKYQEEQKISSVAKATQSFLKTADGKALYEATQTN